MTSTNPASHPDLSSTTRAPLVETRRIARRDPQRGQVLLHPTDFALRVGERATLTGPSGSGKSVFLRALALFEAAGRPADFLARPASGLSGGEAQIVALVRVLQLDPDALLLDEPTASLDPDSARAVEALVGRWFERDPAAHATVWVSHDPAQAARVGRRRLAMQAGVLTEPAGPPETSKSLDDTAPVNGAAR